MYSTWADRYKNLLQANAQQATLEANGATICQNRCTFKIQYVKSDKNYIQGMFTTTDSQVLHIDPTVDVVDDEKKTRDEKAQNYFLFNGSSEEGAVEQKYKLIDIFFQAPSKIVSKDSCPTERCPMEVCLVHQSLDKKRFLLVTVLLVNETAGSTKTKLYDLLSLMGKNFPDKQSQGSLKGVSSWTPSLFLPPEDQRAFFYWLDKEQDPQAPGNTLNLVFQTPLVVPNVFFDAFMTLFANGVTEFTAQSNTPAPKTPNVWFYNEMVGIEKTPTQWKCTPIENEKALSIVQEVKSDSEKESMINSPIPPPHQIHPLLVTLLLLIVFVMISYFLYQHKILLHTYFQG